MPFFRPSYCMPIVEATLPVTAASFLQYAIEDQNLPAFHIEGLEASVARIMTQGV